MIASILDGDEVDDELAELMPSAREGNPFVVEEMLREAIERGDVYLDGGRWERRAIDEVGIPQTVRETILLRIGRLDPRTSTSCARGPSSAARSPTTRCSSSATPARTSSSSRSKRRSARSSSSRSGAHARVLVAARADPGGGLPHDTVRPRRQRLHERAAAALAGAGAPSAEVARVTSSVPACPSAPCPRASRRPRDAERSLALDEAAELLERVLPYLDELEQARTTCRIGRLRWLTATLNPRSSSSPTRSSCSTSAARRGSGLPARARAGVLGDRIPGGRALREYRARARRSRAARAVRRARNGAAADLGMHAFAFEPEPARDAAERAIAVADAAGAPLEAAWAKPSSDRGTRASATRRGRSS